MFHDTVMSLVVVCVIIGLACVWYFTPDERPDDAGWLGPRYTEEADPGTTSFIPRPGLVLLLPLLPAADLQVAGDGRSSARSGSRRSCSSCCSRCRSSTVRRERRLLAAAGRGRGGDPRRHLDGRADLQGRDGEGGARRARSSRRCPSGREQQGFADNEAAIAGAELFAQVGCLAVPHVPRRRARRTSARPT